jgi:hypothetical protein
VRLPQPHLHGLAWGRRSLRQTAQIAAGPLSCVRLPQLYEQGCMLNPCRLGSPPRCAPAHRARSALCRGNQYPQSRSRARLLGQHRRQ